MEKLILSLKTIYKLLMTNDFPMYSESVINIKDRKGQTVLRFWYRQLIAEFRSSTYGRMIWRNDGKRNRYTSHLCNRSSELNCYEEYAHELASQINATTLVKQIESFMEFMSDKEYKYDILIRRIEKLIQAAAIEDPSVSAVAVQHLQNNLSIQEPLCSAGAQGTLFHASWLLTLLTLYSAAGEAMDAVSLLRHDEFSVNNLWEHYIQKHADTHEDITYLTKYVGLLQSGALPEGSFFGREVEFYDLREMALTGRKVLISGIGGIGKTELLRQLLVRIPEEHCIDQIGIIPYENSIADSFVKAFPKYAREKAEDKYRYIINQIKINSERGQKILLMIDDLTNSIEEDPDLKELSKLPCSILITTRRTQLEGFEVYKVIAPLIATSALIFRANYKHALNGSDKELLLTLLENEYICHPLTLQLLGRAARSKKWSLTQLYNYLQKNEVSLSWKEEERTLRLRQIYSQLYTLTSIPDHCKQITELFTLLPYDTYSIEFITDIFTALLPNTENVRKSLHHLADCGWLSESESGYSMHQVIASCLRNRTYSQERLQPVIDCLVPYTAIPAFGIVNRDADTRRICELLIHITGYITGNINEQLFLDVTKAMSMLYPSKTTMLRYQSLLDNLKQRLENPSILSDIRYQTLRGFLGNVTAADIIPVFESYQKHPDIPASYFMDYCISNTAGLMYQQENSLIEILVNEVIDGDATVPQKASAYYHMGVYYAMAGELETRLQWCKRAFTFINEHPGCDEELIFSNTAMLCAIYLQTQQRDEAEELLKKLTGYINDTSPISDIIHYENLAGLYEMNYGDLSKALPHHIRTSEILAEYEGVTFNYLTALGNIALIYQKLKEYDKAIEYYALIDTENEKIHHEYVRFWAHNNASVMYLDMEDPDTALANLEIALPIAENYGGIALGETLKNQARAYRQRKEYVKEFQCLQKACPLLDAAYGETHPRAASESARLSELKELLTI